MEIQEDLKKSLIELRKSKERKFDESVDLIINLQKFDLKKTQLNLFVNVPHKIKDKKVCGFLESKNQHIDTITEDDFKKFKTKSDMKKLVKKYDFFIAQGSLMPKIATTFGRVLGPAGKMPSPQLGILLNAGEKEITELKKKVNNNVKVKAKESSLKLVIGKRSMKDEDIIENILTVYNAVLKDLPRNKENVKNLEVKFTMTKPEKIRIR